MHNKIWKSGSTWYGVKEGAIDITGFGPMVTNNEKMNVLAVRDKICNGQYVVFSGPSSQTRWNITFRKRQTSLKYAIDEHELLR